MLKKEKIVTYNSYLEYFKLTLGVKQYLFDLADTFKLEFEITHEDKGWFRNCIFFRIKGSEHNVEQFKYNLRKTIEEFNQE